MLRLLFKMAFLGALVLALMPGARRAGVFNNGYSVASIMMAAQINAHDLATACQRSAKLCDALASVAAAAAGQAKSSVLTAYHGIRTQYDEPDRQTTTAGIRK